MIRYYATFTFNADLFFRSDRRRYFVNVFLFLMSLWRLSSNYFSTKTNLNWFRFFFENSIPKYQNIDWFVYKLTNRKKVAVLTVNICGILFWLSMISDKVVKQCVCASLISSDDIRSLLLILLKAKYSLLC